MKNARIAAIVLGTFLAITFASAGEARAENIIVNGSFETGDFTSWGTKDMVQPFRPLAVRGAGHSPGLGLFLSAPTDGVYAVTHGFDGAGPDTIEVFQDVDIPPGHSAVLTFDWRGGWDFSIGSPATIVRVLDLVVEPAGGGTALSSTNILTADPAVNLYLPDTGPMSSMLDLSSFAGSSVRINFKSTIPEPFTGPAHLQIDNVVLDIQPNQPVDIAISNIEDAVCEKLALLEAVDAVVAAQQEAKDALDGLFVDGGYDDLGRGDIAKGKEKLHSASQHQIQSADDLEKSIEKLQDALAALGAVFDSNTCDSLEPVSVRDLLTLDDVASLAADVVELGQWVSEVSELETAAYETLEEMLATGEYEGLKKGDIVKAQQKIHAAMQHQVQAADKLEKSTGKTEDALEALGYESQPDPNMVGWWKFDEGAGGTAYDSAGDNDGTLNGAGWTGGKIDGALDFDGTNDYVGIGDKLNGVTLPFSISAWIRKEASGVMGIFASDDDQLNYYEFWFYLRDNTVGIGYGDGTGSGPPSRRTKESNPLIEDDEWTMVTAVVTGPEDMGLYVNGEDAGGTYSGTGGDMVHNPGIAVIGRNINKWGSYFFNGKIDDVCVYDQALSAADVAGLYGAAQGPKAFGPDPADGAALVDPNTVLGWTSATGADSHDVYFGTSFEDVNSAASDSNEFMGNFDVTSFDPAGLELGTSYYWRIDEKHMLGTAKGNVWQFTTVPPAPSQATNPNPLNGATEVNRNADLSWSAGTNTTSHDVYFGTDNPPAFIGNQTATSYDPVTMEYDTTYYWRIDEVGPGGTTAGAVWDFTTKSMAPVAWWKFDEGAGSTAYDSAGDNDGTVQGGAGFTAGKVGSALSLDGINDYVSVPASPSLDFRSSYSIAAWLRPTATPSERMVWFGYHSGLSKKSLHLAVYTNGMIRFGLYGDDLNTAAGTMGFGQWNHVVVTYDYGTDRSRIYVDGSLEASGNSGPYLGGLVAATIGKWNVTFQSQNRWDGLIDDVRVYDRALPAAEVAELYDAVTGPVGWWKFDEGVGGTAYDSVGDNDGTVNGAAWTSGLIDGGLSFDGTNDYVALPDNEPIWLPQNNFTLSGWVYLGAGAGSSNRCILDLNHADSSFSDREVGYGLVRAASTGQVVFYMTTTTDTDDNLVSQDALIEDRWYHIVAVRDGTAQAIYIDGSLDNSRTCSASPIDFVGGYDNNKVSVGMFSRVGVSGGWYFDGSIDDVRIYDRALPAAEIAELYNDGTGLVGWWKFDEGAGSTAYDSAGDNHGTLYGDTSWTTGQIGAGALDFDGDGDYVDVGTMGSFGGSIDNVTISAWVKSDVTNTPMSVFGVVNTTPISLRTQVRIDLNHNPYDDVIPGQIYLFLRDEDGKRLSAYVSSNTGVTNGSWHHVVVVFYTSTNTVKIYLDSSAQIVSYRRKESPVNFADLDRTAYIGACHTSAAVIPFEGSIDDVRIYDRALLAADVARLYGAAQGPKAFGPNPNDGASGVDTATMLGWSAGFGAISHDVYLGTSFTNVDSATTSSPQYKGNQTATTYNPGGLNFLTTYYWRIDENDGSIIHKGDVWSFTTTAPPVPSPGQAGSPNPANDATGVLINAHLTWSAGTGASSHDVFFGTANPPPFVQNQTSTTYDPGIMAYGTTYYWRIDEVGPGSATTGTVWNFTTVSLLPPGQAGSPNPTDGATGVGLLAELSWSAGTGASSHDVYFGTDNPPAFIGNQAGTTYITGIMNYETTYYWRIDEVNPASTTTGQLWSFVTAAPGFLEKADFPNPTDGAMNVSIGIDLSWSQPIGATSYNVYFGTDATPDIDDFKGNQAAATFDPGTLDYKTTYYWRIDVENFAGTATGDVWSFATELAPHEEGTAGDLFWHNVVDKPWQGGSRPAKLDDFVGVHPRLLLTQAKVDELKTKITSGTHKDMWDIIKDKADIYLGQNPINDPGDEEHTRADGDAIPWLAFAYLMTDDTAYLNKAVSWMTTVCNYSQWHNNRSLASAHCLMGVSLGYDWLYNDMTAAQRDTIRNGSSGTLGLVYYADIMGASDESAAKKPQHRERYLSNHCQVEYAGLAAAGLALYDDTSVAGGEDWLRRAYNIFDMAYQVFAEDGSDTEGHQYYGLLTEFQMHFNKMAKEFLGRDFYQESKWLQNAGDFILYSGLPDFTAANCVMRFGDTTYNNYVSHGPIYQMFNLASEYGDPQYQWLAMEMLDRGIGTIDRMGWANLIWYDETIPTAEPGSDGLSAFRHFEDTGWVTSRSDWTADAVMVGFKCGPHNGHKTLKYYERQVAEDWPNTMTPNPRSYYGIDYHELTGGHGHPDVGHFNVYAYGQWLAADDGKTVSGDTKQTSYHSTLLVNGEGQLGEGSKYFNRTAVISAAASSSIIKAKSTAEYDYVVGDAGNIYKDPNLTKFYRHFIYIKPDIIVVVDELESTPSTNIEWRMRMAPTATVTGSGDNYLVSNGSARMDVDFLNPSGLTTAVSGDFLTATLTSTGSDLLVTVLHPRQDTDPAGTAVLTSSSGSILKLSVGAGIRTVAIHIDLASQHLMIMSDSAVSNPTPADGAVDVDVNENLGWTAGTGATSHDVYFGTANPPASIGNQTGTTFEPGTLENGVTYYWRIDEVGPGGTVTGPVWSFTAEAVEAGLWALVEERFANSISLFETDPIYTYPHNYPRSTDPNGEWKGDGYPGEKHEGHWASGFWPGSLWYLYGRTGEQQWKDWAVDWTTPLERHQYRVNDHESGFLIYRSYGFGHNLTAEASYEPIILQACESLVTRYDATVGCIKSWYRMVNPNDPNFRVITDGMMMLEMLYWGAKNGGDPSWYDIAVSHSLKTMENNVRPDGSVWQIVDYDQATGAVVDKWNKQGYDPDSTWSRGQAWGICGFAIAYRETGDVRFLETSKRCADYFIDNLPADLVPYWDFDAPGIPNEPKDSSAAAIAASGMLELSTLVADQRDKDKYFGAACDILDSLASPDYLAADPNMAILLHGTGRANPISGTPDTWEIDCGLIYGDHFFTEALWRKEEIIGR